MHFDQISPKAGSQNTHLCLLSHSQHNNIHLQYCSRQPLCVHDRRRGIVLVPPVLNLLAGLIGTATLKNDGLMSKSGFLSAIGLNLEGDANNVNNGVYKFDSQQDNMPVNYGILVAFSCDGWIRMQLCAGGDNGLAYIRMHYNSWTSWKQI